MDRLTTQLELRDLSERVAIKPRLLRYVVDHELVPDRRWLQIEDAVGQPRQFDGITAVCIACAAHLLEAGYKRVAVSELMAAIDQILPEKQNPLNLPAVAHAITSKKPARVQVGDRKWVRWILDGKEASWVTISPPHRRATKALPMVVIEVDVGRIRDQVFDSE
ncbi:MAG: hypothetical protein MI757_14230 [Pirellulales bacterium]|nr:hypothetical protein [Pirellulales bacterium]